MNHFTEQLPGTVPLYHHVIADPADLSTTLAEERHDAFTGELMARFCEVLAETGMVTQAARAIGKHRDTVYQHRRRNPLFAAAWAGALSHARTRLADALLERSLNGSIDYLYRDGDLVGERRYYDNRLAYSMLRRLDKEAAAEPPAVTRALAEQQPRVPTKADYRTALKALRTGSEEDLCAALAIFGDHETDKPDNPPDPESDAVGFAENGAPASRVWQEDGCWWTNFSPPPGFDGNEQGHWADADYQRECTDEEAAVLDARREAELASTRAAEDAERDAFFAPAPPLQPGEQQEHVGGEQREDDQRDRLVHPLAPHREPEQAQADEQQVEQQVLGPEQLHARAPLAEAPD